MKNRNSLTVIQLNDSHAYFDLHQEMFWTDKFLLLVHGSGDELAKAKDILKSTGHEVSVHSPSER
jgi:hypothetical protein